MFFDIKCPHCESYNQITDSDLGTMFNCSSCSEEFKADRSKTMQAISKNLSSNSNNNTFSSGHQKSDQSRFSYIIISFFLGGLGIHNFFIGRPIIGLLQLMITIFTSGFGLFIVIPWVIIEMILVTKDGKGRVLK